MFTLEKPPITPWEEEKNQGERLDTPSRFGDEQRLLTIMREGNPKILGSIKDLYPEYIGSYRNVVEVAEVKAAEEKPRLNDAFLQTTRHLLETVELEEPETHQKVQCVFKPLDGEDKQWKEKLGLEHLFPREVAAYLISRHFKFDLVPPTIIREIETTLPNGETVRRIGSLQLCLDPTRYLTEEKLDDLGLIDDEVERAMFQARDYQIMALYDFITINIDRHTGNLLIKTEIGEDGQRRVVLQGGPTGQEPEIDGIDHGQILHMPSYENVIGEEDAHFFVRGPSLFLTTERSLTPQRGEGEKPAYNEISGDLLELLKDGLARKDELLHDLSLLRDRNTGEEYIPENEVSYMWQRVQALIEAGHYLSRSNLKKLPKSITAGQKYPHPPLERNAFGM